MVVNKYHSNNDAYFEIHNLVFSVRRSLVSQFEHEETELLVLRVMVGLVILYDHVHPQGAFTKSSNLDVKGCVRLLKEQPPVKSEPLLNALRYLAVYLYSLSLCVGSTVKNCFNLRY